MIDRLESQGPDIGDGLFVLVMIRRIVVLDAGLDVAGRQGAGITEGVVDCIQLRAASFPDTLEALGKGLDYLGGDE